MDTSVFTEEMIQAILDFQDTNPWETLKEVDLFAIQFADGIVGYCSVLGQECDVLGLNYYEGNCGLATYFRSMMEPSSSILDKTDENTLNKTLSCFLTDEEGMDDEGSKAIKKYLRAHKRKSTTPQLEPVLIRVKPGKWPCAISDEQDAQRIIAALQAATYMAKQVQAGSLTQMGFDPESEHFTEYGGDVVPMLIARQGEEGYELSSMTLPEVNLKDYPAPRFKNEALAQRLSALPQRGEYQCKYCYFPSPITIDDEGEACCPDVLAMIGLTGTRCGITMAEDIAPGDAQEMMNRFAEKFISVGSCPQSLIVADAKTKNLLTDFCKQCGITLCVQKEIPLLEKTYSEFLNTVMG